MIFNIFQAFPTSFGCVEHFLASIDTQTTKTLVMIFKVEKVKKTVKKLQNGSKTAYSTAILNFLGGIF